MPPVPRALDLTTAQLVNAPDVRSWPETAQITAIRSDGVNLRLEFTKRDGPDRWPDVRPPGWSGDVHYTVWLFVQLDSRWIGSGFIQMWAGRDGVGDVPSDFHRNWYYGTRWNPMPDHGPIRPGEPIGFMVTSGNARDRVGPFGPQERSNAVIVPAADVGTYDLRG